ncbi:MAG: glycosyltransferase family 4 protein [Planctomycetota bacterium]
MPRETTEVRKVLLLTPEMEARGISECSYNLACELQRMEVEVAVFCAPGPMLDRLPRAGIPVRKFEHLEGMGLHFGEQKKFLSAAEEFSPQIVHGHSFRVAGALKLLLKNSELPAVLTLHRPPSGGRGLRKLSQRLAGLIATTQSVRAKLVNRCGVDKQKVKVIHNGIDAKRLKGRDIPPAFRSGTPAVGSLGPIEEEHGHELFVRAAEVLVERGVKAEFVVAGQGQELPEIRALIDRAGLQHFVTVAADFSAYEDVLGALDVVVQSSQVDVSGFSILEAMAHARPVVAFNTGTACEIIEDEKTGLLVPKGDINALAGSLQRLIEDTGWARAMGERGQAVVQDEFSIRTMTLETLRYYASVLSAGPASSS